jgi:hypothetical protein
VAKEVLIASRGDNGSAPIRRLIDEIHALNVERVRVAHGLWVPSSEGGTVHHVPRGKLRTATYSDQAAVLEKKADEANKLRAKLDHAFTSSSED